MPVSVLIADDDQNIVLALRFLMEKEGYRVRAVSDGEAALAAIAEEPADLVLLDVMMPKRNGYDVCAAIRGNRRYDKLCVVMLTAKGRDAERQLGAEAGADDYITKPFSTREVLERIRLILARRPAKTGRGSADAG
jgi:two-component system, OmpR family, alkaline phosphatase synthesis response regulator PhoP